MLEDFRKKVWTIISEEPRPTRNQLIHSAPGFFRDPREIRIPDFYLSFLEHLLADCNPSNILTFGSGSVEICEYALERFPEADVYCLPVFRGDAERVRGAFSRECHFIDYSSFESNDTAKVYDLIIGRMMLESTHQKEPHEISIDNVDLGSLGPYSHVINSAFHLSDDGIGIFAVPPSLFTKDEWNETYNKFKEFGLAIRALFHISPGMDPRNPVFRYIILIQKRPSEALFIAELGKDPKSYQYILSNFWTGKRGKVPSLGAWIPPTTFVSFPIYAETERIQQFAKKINGAILKLTDLGEIVSPIRESGYGNSEFVYIPRYPRSPVEIRTGSPEDWTRRNFYKFDYNPALVTGEYLVNYFNSDYGLRQRSALSSGSTMPQLSRRDLQNAIVILPKLPVQQQVNIVKNKIAQLSGFLESLDISMWQDLRSANEIEHTLDKLLEFDDLKRWMETLPFPLASVLYRYTISTDVKEKFEWLLKFYEAVAAFQVILLLSGLCSRGECVAEALEIEGLDNRINLDVASFGTWIRLSKALRKTIKKKVNPNGNLESREYYISLFGNPSPEFIEMLLSPRFDSVFFPVKDIRNKWKGHEGIVPEQKYEELLQELEQRLPVLRSIIKDTFRQALLILPVKSRFTEGVFKYTVKVLADSRVPFREEKFETVSPMDDRFIYLLHAGQNVPVQIIPFLQMLPTPTSEREACYFYNRVESSGDQAGKIRLITYHYGESPEAYIESNEIKKYLDIFRE